MIGSSYDKMDKMVLAGAGAYFVILIIFAVQTTGTCDSGDSIYHYLFSKYAFHHPTNFLDHWAKPVFVLLSSPFAQFGFVGIKIFNSCVAALTVWFCYITAKALGYKSSWLAAVFLCFTPGYFIHIFSGLTEPLFGLILISGIYLVATKRILAAACIVSFLPFVRSEGLIIIGVFVFYLLLTKQFMCLPWLLLGHIVYSVVGSFHHQDILWVFTKIPYAGSSGKYGSGTLFHFIIQLNYIIGIPIYLLLALGFIGKIYESFSARNFKFSLYQPDTLFIYLLFIGFVAAHSLFWYLGIFESMGLKRVLVAIVPLAVIIALKGFNFITGLFKHTFVSNALAIVFSGFVILFPSVPNPASVDWQKDLSLGPDQVLLAELTGFVKSNFASDIIMYYAHPYILITLDRDPFSEENRKINEINFFSRPANYIVIWDSWFAQTENGVSLEHLQADPQLTMLKNLEVVNKGRKIQIVLFANTR